MDRGRIRFGASMLYSYINAAHDVDPEQYEPGILTPSSLREYPTLSTPSVCAVSSPATQ